VSLFPVINHFYFFFFYNVKLYFNAFIYFNFLKNTKYNPNKNIQICSFFTRSISWQPTAVVSSPPPVYLSPPICRAAPSVLFLSFHFPFQLMVDSFYFCLFWSMLQSFGYYFLFVACCRLWILARMTDVVVFYDWCEVLLFCAII
jgi:hypothetical protein